MVLLAVVGHTAPKAKKSVRLFGSASGMGAIALLVLLVVKSDLMSPAAKVKLVVHGCPIFSSAHHQK